jgi:hypothetical protein
MWRKLMQWLGRGAGRRSLGAVAELSDEEVFAGLEVDGGHPVLRSVLELSRRAEMDARDQARAVIKDHAEVAYFLGAEWQAESFREYVEQARREALRRAAERDGGV